MHCPGCNTPVFLAEIEVIDNPACDLLKLRFDCTYCHKAFAGVIGSDAFVEEGS